MSFKLTGDFARKLERWQQLLRSSDAIVTHTSRAQAEVALTLIGEGFQDETDPYGDRWKPKQKPDGRKVLHGETSRLRTGWHIESAGKNSWQVAPSVPYAAYNQPTRMQVPSASRGLPDEWAKEFEAVAVAEAIHHFAETATGPAPSHKKRTRSRAAGSGVAKRAAPASKRSSGTRKLRKLRKR